MIQFAHLYLCFTYLYIGFKLFETRSFWFCNCSPPEMLLTQELFKKKWIEHVTIALLYVKFNFSTGIVYNGVSGFSTDCPCGVCCRGLTHHGPMASPASWPHSAARPMARVYLSACSPRGQWACRGYFPSISGELLNQQRWAVLDCGRGSGSSIII